MSLELRNRITTSVFLFVAAIFFILIDELIFGKISKGGHVSITLKDDKITFNFSSKEVSKKVLA